MRFSNQKENKGRPSSKSKFGNKKKNMTCAKQESNKILLQGKNKNKTMTKKTYTKFILNKLKVIGNFTFIYTY